MHYLRNPRVSTSAAAPDIAVTGPRRWYTYQRERFPLLAHGPIILAFSAGGVLYSARLRQPGPGASAASLTVAFITCLLFFFQLRVSDEYKDAEEDALHRPYRPVPRGLVTITQLVRIGIGATIVQLLLALWLDSRLVLLLILVWSYIGLMTAEFWAHRWLAARPIAVIATHMLVMPLIDLYATACDWLVHGAGIAPGLRWFLIASFFNGVVIELGRKIRAPESEERGVATYTAVWGRGRALAVWLGAMSVTGACAAAAAYSIHALTLVLAVLGALLIAAVSASIAFLSLPNVQRARLVPALSGAWTIAMYATVGVIPGLHIA